MKLIGFLLRFFSYLFHLVLSLFLLGIAAVAASSHQPLQMGMLPFDDEHMVAGLFWLAVLGLVITLLAITNLFRYTFPLWAVLVLYLMVNGFLFSSYGFRDESDFKTACALMLGAVVALVGAIWVLKPRRGRLYL